MTTVVVPASEIAAQTSAEAAVRETGGRAIAGSASAPRPVRHPAPPVTTSTATAPPVTTSTATAPPVTTSTATAPPVTTSTATAEGASALTALPRPGSPVPAMTIAPAPAPGRTTGRDRTAADTIARPSDIPAPRRRAAPGRHHSAATRTRDARPIGAPRSRRHPPPSTTRLSTLQRSKPGTSRMRSRRRHRTRRGRVARPVRGVRAPAIADRGRAPVRIAAPARGTAIAGRGRRSAACRP